jgi:ribosomal protein S18 acetylase RimI-like enzyme
VQIRRLEPREWKRYRDLRLRALLDTPDAFASTHAEQASLDDDYWRGRAGDEESAIFVTADFSAMAIGFLRAPGKAGLVSMWVAPESRGRGLGSGLVERVVSWAEDIGADEVTLWANEQNAAALGLYERAGFAATGERKPLASTPGASEIELGLTLPR